MAKISPYVSETCNAAGTGTTVQLIGAQAGYVSFAQAFKNGDTVFYFMDDNAQAEWGLGVLTIGQPNTLFRLTVLGNTAGTTNRLNFTAITQIYNEIPGQFIAQYSQSGQLSVANAVNENDAAALGQLAYRILWTTNINSGDTQAVVPLPSGYKKLKLEVNGIIIANGSTGAFYLQGSTDNGNTWQTTFSDANGTHPRYNQIVTAHNSANTQEVFLSNGSLNSIVLSDEPLANSPSSFDIDFHIDSGLTSYKGYGVTSTNPSIAMYEGVTGGIDATFNAIRIYCENNRPLRSGNTRLIGAR